MCVQKSKLQTGLLVMLPGMVCRDGQDESVFSYTGFDGSFDASFGI